MTVSLEPADIEGFLAWRVMRTARAVERSLVAVIVEHGLTPMQFGVLSLLATGEQYTQSDLARAALVRPQSIGPVVEWLTEHGLVARRGPGGRGRRAHYDLTAAGRRLLDDAWPEVTARRSAANLGLNAADSRRLDQLLRTVESAASHIDENREAHLGE